MAMAKELRLGDRGDEALGWLWRLGCLTPRQYARLAKEPDEAARETGLEGARARAEKKRASDSEGGPGGEPGAEPEGGEEDAA